MPSISNPSKVDKQLASLDPNEPLGKVQLLVDNKIRNLEKRKSRLEQYKEEARSGKELNADQKKAIKKYEEVAEMLEFFREFKKNVQTIYAEHAKVLKKKARKDRPFRDSKEIERLGSVILYQDLLNGMGGEVARNDFLKGSNGAIQITEEKLAQLDEFCKLVYPDRARGDEPFLKQLNKAAERYLALVEGIKADAFKGTSYRELKETLISINESGYFDVSVKKVTPSSRSSNTSKPSATSAPSQQQQKPAENVTIGRVTESETTTNTIQEVNQPSATFESSNVKRTVTNESQVPNQTSEMVGASGGSKYSQSKARRANSNQTGMNEIISNVGSVSAPTNSAPSGYNFLQESRLEMEGAPHMDPAVVAMPPGAGSFPNTFGGNQSVEALAAQLSGLPMSSAPSMTKGVTTYENTGSHQPIPTQTFTNQRFTAMMAGGTFVQPVPIAAYPPMLGLPVQLVGQTMASHPSGTNEQIGSNNPNNNDANQGHGMMGALGSQTISGPGSEANSNQYQASSAENNQRSNQAPSRDKHSYQGDGENQSYGSNYGRYRRGRGGGPGGPPGGPRSSGKYNPVNGHNSRGGGRGGSGPRNPGKPHDKPKSVADNRNVSNQWP